MTQPERHVNNLFTGLGLVFGETIMNGNAISTTWNAAVFIAACIPAAVLWAADGPVTFRFEPDAETWKPRAETISVSYENPGTADSAGCLRVRGRIAGG